jgi:hypothetical protein
MSLFHNDYPSVVHVYHHYESKPCSECGYRMNTGYYDPEWSYEHLMHTVRDNDILLKRVLDTGKAKTSKKKVSKQ